MQLRHWVIVIQMKSPISKQMLKRCKGACTEYERELKERREQELLTKKEKEVELAKRQEREEEQQRQEKVRVIKEKNKEVDTEIERADENIKHAESFSGRT